MQYEKAETFMLGEFQRGLPRSYHYHSYRHILDVMQSAKQIAQYEKVGKQEALLIRTAALFHDSGLLVTYNNHEIAGCDRARTVLPKYGYEQQAIEAICHMILSTTIPQHPENLMEEILCDADLDYLGRDDYEAIGWTLFDEYKERDMIQTKLQWYELQVSFLGNHHYFTSFGKQYREPLKQQHLENCKRILEKMKNHQGS